jgi:hypothetical protein
MLSNFSKFELALNGKPAFPEPDVMHPQLMILMELARQKLGYPIDIHCSYDTKGHAISSRHYDGKAIDCSSEVDYKKLALTFKEVADYMELKIGLGLYPFWNNKGVHIDVRPEAERTSYWVRDHDEVYLYRCDFDTIIEMAKNLEVVA